MNFAVLDFETTGNLPADEIIQVGLVRVIDGQLEQSYTSLVQTKGDIPPFITQLTGICKEDTASAPELDEVMTELLPLLQDCTIVAHHASFDIGFLQRALEQCGYNPFDGPILDLIDLLKICWPGLSGYQLSFVSETFGVNHTRPHQADSDAEATALLLIRCLDKLSELPLLTLQRLSSIFNDERDGLSQLMSELTRLKQVEGDLYGEQVRAYRQFALHVDDWMDEEDSVETSTKVDLADEFEPFAGQVRDGLRERFEQFEEREAQTMMMDEVFTALSESRHLLIEAGTGTGKSLGYLVPALYYALQSEEKVIVSTHTINLQEQLRQRDIPLLEHIFPVPIRTALLKGRSHYLCLRKFENKINLQDYEHRRDERIRAAQMVVWLGETSHGDEEELNLGAQGRAFWHSVASDADSCLNRACPWFRKCFYHRARYKAQSADLVITNHSLLFTDVKAEHRLLPAYDHLIVDEAHHFEQVAEQHLGTSVHELGVSGALTGLYKDAASGMLPALAQQLNTGGYANADEWSSDIHRLSEQLVELKQVWEELAAALYGYLEAASRQAGENGSLSLRLRPSELDDRNEQWSAIRTMEDNFYVLSGEMIRSLVKLADAIRDKEDDTELSGMLTDLGGYVQDLSDQRDDLRFIVRMEKDDHVYWMEATATFKIKSLRLNAVPIDVSPLLKQYFFDVKESVVLTSATLTVDKSFDYAQRQLGLTSFEASGRLNTVSLPSPFDYRKQALVCIPRDFPKLGYGSGEEPFIERLSASLSEIAISTRGRMMALFTSYRMLKEVYARMKERLEQEAGQIELLGQSIDGGNRSKLTRRFLQNPASVLLGTSSFWEGVDIPGEALSCLAIVRLPFQPPHHPVVEAKCEQLKEQNENPFMKYSVPQAVIRFKQGFGRLVRTAGDKGIAVVYDTRIIESRYGKNFLYSLPGPKIEHMPTDNIVPRIREWLESDLESGEEEVKVHAGRS